MEKPLVSVIVPVYNVEKYLRECLDSLVNQTLKNIEIICINDGSIDNSLSILEEYAKNDLRVKIIDQVNSGVSVARNNGIKLATGEFIGFCDSDDWVDLDYFEKLYTAATKYNCEIAMCGIVRHRKFKNKKWLAKKVEKVCFDIEDVMREAKIPQYSYIYNKIYKRDALLGLDLLFPIGRIFEDIYWSARVVTKLKGLVCVPNIFYHYRTVEGSIVSLRTQKRIDDEKWAIEETIKYIEENNIPVFCKISLEEKKYVKLFGVKLLAVEHLYPNKIVYKVFGFIPFSFSKLRK